MPAAMFDAECSAATFAVDAGGSKWLQVLEPASVGIGFRAADSMFKQGGFLWFSWDGFNVGVQARWPNVTPTGSLPA